MPPRLAFWWVHARLTLTVLLPLALVVGATDADATLAHALFFDPWGRWLGAGSLWANEILHTGGGWAVRGLLAAVLLFWLATFGLSGLRPYRRPAGYFLAAGALSVGLVGLLKAVTGIPCPWSLAEFGGTLPSWGLFDPRPPGTVAGQCFPAAHASSGYALTALYFTFRERHKLLARLGLTAGILTGVIFGLAQQSRGAHFLSHDLWSAFLVWMVALTLYTVGFKGTLWTIAATDLRHEAPRSTGDVAAVQSSRLRGSLGRFSRPQGG